MNTYTKQIPYYPRISLLRQNLSSKFTLGVLCAAVAASTAWADNPATTVSVDANANRHAISPLIYGANVWTPNDADTTTLINDLNLAVNRRGGNATTTYNWQVNATNRSGDWFFESMGDSNGSSPSAGPDGTISATKAAGAEILLTIPIVDWVAKLGGTHP